MPFISNFHVFQGHLLSSTEILQFNNIWVWGPPLPSKYLNHCVSPVTNDFDETRFVLIGGQANGPGARATTFLFDWSWKNDSWAQLGNLASPANWHTCGATTLSSGKNVVVTIKGAMDDPEVQFLDEGTTNWYSGPPLPYGRKYVFTQI